MAAAQPQRHPQHQQDPNSRILRVGVILGGTIVEERLIRDRKDVLIGQSAKNAFAIPIEGLPRSWALFVYQEDRWYLQFSDKMDGRLSDGGSVHTLDGLKSKGAQRRGNGWILPLTENARGKISLGELTLLFQFVTEPPRQPRPHLPASVRGTFADRIEPQLAIILAISILFHFAVGLYAYQRDRVIEKRATRIYNETFQQAKYVDVTFEAPKVEPTEAAAKPTEDKPKDAEEKPKAAKQPKDSGKSKGDNRPKTDQSAGRSAEEALALQEEIERAVNALTGDDENPFGTNAGTSGRDPKDDLERAIAEVERSGATVKVGGGSNRGTRGGDDRIGTGKGPDVKAPSDTQSAGEKRKERVPTSRIKVGGKSGLDETTLTPDAVLRKIQSVYMRGLQRCHKDLLKRDPSAGGRVTLNFTVGETGRVTRAKASGFDSGVDACINGQMKAWRFAVPKDSDGDPTDAAFKITLVLQAQ